MHVSTCLAALSDVVDGSSVSSRFEVLETEFQAFCRREHESPAMAKLTSAFIGWNSRSEYPGGS